MRYAIYPNKTNDTIQPAPFGGIQAPLLTILNEALAFIDIEREKD